VYFTDSGPSADYRPGFTERSISAVVRNLNSRTGWMTTVAGVGLPGSYGVGGPAWRAELSQPCAIAFDHHGNLIVVNGPSPGVSPGSLLVIAARAGFFYGQRMRAGHLYPIALPSLPLFLFGVAVDYAGNLVLTSTGGFRTRGRVLVLAARSGTFYGRAMRAGHFYTVWKAAAPGTANDSVGPVTVDRAGNPVVSGDSWIFVLAARSGRFDGRRMRAGHAYPLTSASAGFTGPATVDQHGNVVAVGGSVAVLAMRSGRFYGRAMRAGKLYRISGGPGFGGDGGPVADAKFSGVHGITTDGSGNLVIADTGNHRVRVVAVRTGTYYGIKMLADHVYTVAGNGSRTSDSGDGGLATRAELSQFRVQSGEVLAGVATDSAGDVFLSDMFNNRVRMVPARAGTFFSQRMRAGGIYTIAGVGGANGDSGNGGPARKARLALPAGLAVDAHGNVLVADSANRVVRVVAARTGTFYGTAMLSGHIYPIAGGGSQTTSGVPATALSIYPNGLAVDRHGNLLIVSGVFSGSTAGVWAVAAKTGTFYGQAMTAGHIYLIAGGGLATGDAIPAVGASMPNPVGVAVDHAGNVVIASKYQNPEQEFRVRVVAVSNGTFYGQKMTAEDIYTIAGGGSLRGSGHLATDTRLNAPWGVAISGSGNVLVSLGNTRLDAIAVKSGRFYGQRMTALHLYSIAGGGNGIVPDNRLATRIALLRPQGVAVDPAGNAIVSAIGENRVILVRA
jgi:hypothetical protein